jgi:heme a synthase
VSLIAFAATFLSAAAVFDRTRSSPPHMAPVTAPRSLRMAVVGVGVFVLGVVYLGAYVRHAGVSLACADWPLCNGQLVPPLQSSSGVVFSHRVAGLAAIVLLAWLATRAQAAGIGSAVAWLVCGLAVAQAASGALVVTSRLNLFSTLAHAAIMALLFAAFALLTRRVVRSDVTHQAAPALRRYSYDDLRSSSTAAGSLTER